MERPEKGRKLGKVAEPVVHFKEWTTSWGGKAGKWPETGEEAEPVVHSGEWTTS